MLNIIKLENNEQYQSEIPEFLWIDSKRAIIPNNESVQVTLIEECDPMFKFTNDKHYLEEILPLTFEGEVNKL